MKRLSEIEGCDNTSSVCSSSYNDTLANFHPFLIRKAAGLAMYALPSKQMSELILSHIHSHLIDIRFSPRWFARKGLLRCNKVYWNFAWNVESYRHCLRSSAWTLHQIRSAWTSLETLPPPLQSSSIPVSIWLLKSSKSNFRLAKTSCDDF